MKVELQRPTLFMLVGLPGSGKTYLARHLVKRLGVPVVSLERIRQTILKQPTLSRQEEAVIWQVGAMLIEGYLSVGLSVVCDVDVNTHQQRDELKRIANFFKAKPIIIWQQIDQKTAWARCQNRQPNQNVDDLFALVFDRTTFDTLVNQFQSPIRNQTIVVSGKHDATQQLTTIIRRLVELQLIQSGSDLTQTIPKPELINLVSSQTIN